MTPEHMAALHARASTSPWSAESFAAQLAQSGSILAHKEHAFALGRATLDEAELLHIATEPDKQRQGLGTQMLIAFERAAKDQGCTRAFLEVASRNAAAQALYTTCGWKVDGRRKDYYRDADGRRDDALVMSKTL